MFGKIGIWMIGVWFFLSGIAADLSAQSAGDAHWTGTWSTSEQYPGPQTEADATSFSDITLRQFVHLTMGGSVLRLHISNEFGATSLKISSVYIAKPESMANCKVDASTNKLVTFAGSQDVVIPPGAEYISDPVSFAAAPLSDLAITLYLGTPSIRRTGHPGSRTTSCIGQRNMVTAAEMPMAKKIEQWFYISGVDVESSPNAGAIVALGDSITDGHGATTNVNDRWPDLLAAKLQSQPSTARWSVLNQGIGGNHILTDGTGQNVLARLDRDVLSQVGVRYLIVFEAINDLGGPTRMGAVSESTHHALVEQLIAGYQQIILRAHAHGIKVIGATVLADGGSSYYHPDATNEADRAALNQWIKAPGHFDAVVDLDKITADPQHPERMLPDFDSGDHLHPGPKGYKVIGEAFPASLFQ